MAASVSIAAAEDSTYVEVNEEFLKVSGFSRDEVIRKTPVERRLFADPSDFERVADELRQKGELRNRETLFRIKSGELRWGLLSAAPITIQGQLYVLGVSRDLTDLKRSQAALLELEQRFRSVLNHAPVGIAVVDQNCAFTFAAGQAFSDAGLAPQKVIGRSIFELFGSDTPIVRGIRRALDGHSEAGIFEFGRSVLSLWTAPLQDSPGLISGALVIGTNITERIQAERRLEQAVRARDVFLSVASHELRNPLNALSLNLTGVIRKAKGKGGAVEPRLLAAAGQVQRLIHLVDELLDVSRITTGHLALKREQFDLAEIVYEVIAQFDDELGDYTFAPVSAVGNWDRVRIEQVVTNLISNAIKYGQGKPISIAIERHGSAVKLRVKDRGIGIAPSDQLRVFDQFDHATSNAEKGLGLGLWITKRIIEAHGGTITFAAN